MEGAGGGCGSEGCGGGGGSGGEDRQKNVKIMLQPQQEAKLENRQPSLSSAYPHTFTMRVSGELSNRTEDAALCVCVGRSGKFDKKDQKFSTSKHINGKQARL